MSNTRPLFLLCNDDGVHAPGLNILADAVKLVGDVVIVAPHVERSANSHMITIWHPLRVERLADNVFAVEGTPADCIILALDKILERRPTWILSGINRGANLGTDTLYSGTVAAAMEGAIAGISSMAVSLAGEGVEHYATAGRVIQGLLDRDGLHAKASGKVLNVNVPDLPFDEIKDVRLASLGQRLYHVPLKEGVDPRGRAYYWHGAPDADHRDLPGSDCNLIEQGYVTLTVLKPSQFDEQSNQELATLLNGSKN